MIEATNLQFAYAPDQDPVIKDVSITLKPGEITCLIGPSGSGKTTLLKTLSLLEWPRQGRLTIAGHDYDFPMGPEARANAPRPWPELTVVFQSLFLWPHLSLRENIRLPASNHKPAEQVERDIDELVDFFNMGSFIDHYPNEASIGQRQRAALARALILDPEYIFLDEITSALDVEQVALLLTRLEKLKKEGIGIFIITHLIEFARRSADQIAFIDDQTLIETGTPEILDYPQTARLQEFLSVIRDAR